MIDPFTLIILAKIVLFAGAAAVVVQVTLLTVAAISGYIRSKRTEKSKEVPSAILKKALDNGEYEVNVGFWEDGEFADVMRWQAKDVEQSIKDLPDGKLQFSHRPEPPLPA